MVFDTIEEQLEVVANYKEVNARVDLSNVLFQRHEYNFESMFYPFNALPRLRFRKQYLGAVPPEEEENIIEPLIDINGTVVIQPAARRKRATGASAGPECQNLPAYKNWAEEGKTAPVQHQSICGEVKI